jgi:hypothetical protein
MEYLHAEFDEEAQHATKVSSGSLAQHKEQHAGTCICIDPAAAALLPSLPACLLVWPPGCLQLNHFQTCWYSDTDSWSCCARLPCVPVQQRHSSGGPPVASCATLLAEVSALAAGLREVRSLHEGGLQHVCHTASCVLIVHVDHSSKHPPSGT